MRQGQTYRRAVEELAVRRETLFGKRRATQMITRDYAGTHLEHEPDYGFVADGGSTAHRGG